MKNLADIRHSMHAISDTRQITSAMRLISVSKMQKAIARREANSLHFERVQATMKDILLHSPDVHHNFFDKQEEGVPAYIVIAGDKGLCGGYNHNVLNYAYDIISKKERKVVITVGQESRVFFQRKKLDIDIEYLHIAQNPTLYSARKLTAELINMYKTMAINEINIIYTKFISTFMQVPRMIELLPIEIGHFADIEVESSYTGEVRYLPSPAKVLEILVPQYIDGIVYGALIQSYASEHCARMVAMEAATKNADEMLASLDVELNRARQAAITSEITEIVSAMEALR